MAASKLFLGTLVPVMGAGVTYAMSKNWSTAPNPPVVQNEVRDAVPQQKAFALARTASEKAKKMVDSAQKLHGDYVETFVKENAIPGIPESNSNLSGADGKKFGIKRSLSKITVL